MKILLDSQERKVLEKSRHSSLILGQLLTPLTRYLAWEGAFAIDNGAFTGFPEERFRTLLARNSVNRDRCLFVTCPDIVGSGRRSLELFKRRRNWIPEGWKIAFVAQDGIEDMEIPWDDMHAIFVGGKDPWKTSQAVLDVIKTAKLLNKWVHIGRVNTPRRYKWFADAGADSCDGSGVARYDHMLASIEAALVDGPMLFDLDNLT